MSKSRSGLRRQRSTFEWVILAVSIAAIASIAGGLIFFSLSLEVSPPDLRVDVRTEGDHFVLTVDNRGGTTAEEVRVEVRRGDRVQEIEIRAVPKGDVEEAVLSIEGQGVPVARVTSYKEP